MMRKAARQLRQGNRNIIFFSFLTASAQENQALAPYADHFSVPCAHFFSLPPTAGFIDALLVLELHCGRDSQVTRKPFRPTRNAKVETWRR